MYREREREVQGGFGAAASSHNRRTLVLDEKLDTLDGGSSSLRDGSGDTTHCSSGQRSQYS